MRLLLLLLALSIPTLPAQAQRNSGSNEPDPAQNQGDRSGDKPGGEGDEGGAEGEEPAEPEAVPPEEQRENLADTVEGMVEALSENGVYSLRDAVTKKDWKVRLTGVDAQKVQLIEEGARAVVPAAFKSADGKHTLVADIFLKKSDEGFEQEKAQVRVLDGKTKFTYDKDFNVIAPPKARPPKKKAKRAR